MSHGVYDRLAALEAEVADLRKQLARYRRNDPGTPVASNHTRDAMLAMLAMLAMPLASDGAEAQYYGDLYHDNATDRSACPLCADALDKLRSGTLTVAETTGGAFAR